jgi:hypothetical protein
MLINPFITSYFMCAKSLPNSGPLTRFVAAGEVDASCVRKPHGFGPGINLSGKRVYQDLQQRLRVADLSRVGSGETLRPSHLSTAYATG